MSMDRGALVWQYLRSVTHHRHRVRSPDRTLKILLTLTLTLTSQSQICMPLIATKDTTDAKWTSIF